MTPPPRQQLRSSWSGPRPLPSSGPRDWRHRHPGGVNSPPSAGLLPISHTQRDSNSVGRQWRRWSGSGIKRDEVTEDVQARVRFRKVSLRVTDPDGVRPGPLRAGAGRSGSLIPRPSVPQARRPHWGGGRGEGTTNQGPTHPRSRKRRLRDSPEGAGRQGRRRAATTPGPLPNSPQRPGNGVPGPGA